MAPRVLVDSERHIDPPLDAVKGIRTQGKDQITRLLQVIDHTTNKFVLVINGRCLDASA